MTVVDLTALEEPTPLELVSAEQADTVVQRALQELVELESQVKAAEREADELEAQLERRGASPSAFPGNTERFEDVIARIGPEAEQQARQFVEDARRRAARLLDTARVEAARLTNRPVDNVVAGGEAYRLTATFSSPPVAEPLVLPTDDVAESLARLRIPEPVPPMALPQSVVPQPAIPVVPHDDLRRPLARTIALLHVVLWSVLIAAVLVVGLAWFA